MKYRIKTDNYKNFSVYKDNVLQPRAAFIPFHSPEAMQNTDIRNERYCSDMVTVLSGEWDFLYYPDGTEAPELLDTDAASFDRVTVPSCWQFTGYEKPYYVNTRYQFKPNPPEIPENCALGVYRRFFEIDSLNANYTLSFLGVAGALDVFVNGSYVGYSEGSHNTSEFELNSFLKEGNNELVVTVHKFSNGTYLECQDMFRNNGIFRDVLLTKTGNNSIYDFEFKATRLRGGEAAEYSLNVLPSMKLTEECELTVYIYDDGKLLVSSSVNQSPEALQMVKFSALPVHEWSAEIPYLYDIVLLLTCNGMPVEYIRRPFGFRSVHIESNVFRFNHQPIKLFGVNHHDTDPKRGYVMRVEDMERDISLCKQYNVNCIRTSHYPPDSTFLDLCDEYGIYVVDEADIETHGCQTELHRPGACSHNPLWQGRYWDRVYRMFERDKNHPSIVMWSLGNEAWGYKNQDYCYTQLKKLSDIPIHYEGVVHTRRFAYDVISQMYPWQGKMKRLADGKGLPKKWYSKPYFLCEYAHAMGVGAGELETYVRDFLRADNLMGGCIWEFADHAVYHENGEYQFTYGGDHGEEKHDGNFCVDGLFYPDRTPHAGALQMKNCYRPVRAERLGDAFVFQNLNYFSPVRTTVKWQGFDGARLLESGEFQLILAPRERKTVDLKERVDSEYFVFRYYDGDFEVASEYHPSFGFPSVNAPMATVTDSTPSVIAEEDSVIISFDGLEARLGASLYRAPLDNDMYLNKVWEKMALKTERLHITGKTDNGNEVTVTANIENARGKRLSAVRFVLKREKGALALTLHCDSARLIPFTPRFGLTVSLPQEMENVRYFGLGERQNLPDFQEHALLGDYAMKVDEMRENYIKPQESAMRCGVRWAALTDEGGSGLCFESVKRPFIFSADRFTSQQCAAAKHREDLVLQAFTYLHFDSYQLGAGSAACGPPPTREFRKNCVKGETLSIKIRRI